MSDLGVSNLEVTGGGAPTERRWRDRNGGRGPLSLSVPTLLILLGALGFFYLNAYVSGTGQGASAAAENLTYEGFFTPEDGNTVYLGDDRFRLWGIDAPDEEGPASEYYLQSGAALLKATELPWTCEDMDQRSYGRIVAKCEFSNGSGSVNEWMVRNGYAVDWPDLSGGAYAEAQRAAMLEQLGIWQTTAQSWR